MKNSKKNRSFEATIAYLLGISGCVSNGLGLIFSIYFSFQKSGLNACIRDSLPTLLSMLTNLLIFIILVVKKHKYLVFMQLSVIINGLLCFPMMLHRIGYVFINYYYILAVFAGLCLVNKWYFIIIIPFIIIIADCIVLTNGQNSIDFNQPLKMVVGPTLSFLVVFLLVYVFNKENMADKKRIKDHEKTLELLAARDVLTSAYNRRMFDEDSKVKDFKYVIMIDIDHFKHVNDTYGHQAGDKVLRDMVDLLYDDRCYEFQLYRYGGEEFAILSMYDSKKTLELLSKFIDNVRESLTVKNKQHITVSCGIAKKTAVQGLQYIIREADTQLYRAKQDGRNCVYYDNAKIL